MPPKAKFEKNEIVSAALEIVERYGKSALTARSLAEKLGSSSRPIFTVFNSMEDVNAEVIKAASGVYTSEYVKKGLSETPAFKGVGKSYIRFAAEKPKLFSLLFMSEKESVPDISSVLGLIEDSYEDIIKSIETTYGLCGEKAFKLYLHLWVYTHGIAVLTATKVCVFTEKEISDMLTDVFSGVLKRIKEEPKND